MCSLKAPNQHVASSKSLDEGIGWGVHTVGAASQVSGKTQNMSTYNTVPDSRASGPALQLVLRAAAPGPAVGVGVGVFRDSSGRDSSSVEHPQKGPECQRPGTDSWQE